MSGERTQKTTKNHLVVHTSTWNLGNKEPPAETVDNGPHWRRFLHPQEEGEEDERDLVVFSFQEIDRFNDFFESRDESWTHVVTDELTADSKFVRLAAVRMEKILLLVFIRRSLLHRVRNLRTTHTKTGLAGLKGNKGGVTVRLTLMGREICIIGSHLAAHLSEEAERIIDFTSILDEQHFRFPDEKSDRIKILDHDYVIVAGDLNFRLDDVPRDHVIGQLARIEDDDDDGKNNNNNNNNNDKNDRRTILDELLVYDQLREAFRDQKCFDGFEEAEIDFKPTYKFDKHDRTLWDQSEKQRKPAWTDRVIWRVHPEKKLTANAGSNAEAGRPLYGVESRFYGSKTAFITSDHKPVVSQLRLVVDEFSDDDVKGGISKGVDDNVIIEILNGNWKSGEDGICRVTLPTGFEPGSHDWLGIFPADKISHLKDFVTWNWLKVAAKEKEEEEEGKRRQSGRDVRRLTFASKYLKSKSSDSLPLKGKYLVMYISGDYDNVFGISPVFEIV